MTTKQIVQQELFTMAYQQYEKSLRWHAFFRLRDRAASQDLVQNTFMKAWNYITEGGQIYKMKAFLYKILNNLIVDEYRKHKTESLDSLVEKNKFQEPMVADHERMADVFDGKMAISLIEQLPSKFRKIIDLRYLKDLSIEEISLATGDSKNAVTVQAYRGRQKLRLLYK